MNTALPATAVTDLTVDPSNWVATLNCSFETVDSRTIVRRDHIGPLSIQRPFYPEGEVAHVYVLHPPGGVVGGDRISINADVEQSASGLVTTPGATKFYRSEGPLATVKQQITNNGGSIEWLAQENIYFSGCKVRLQTDIDVTENAAIAWWEINCFGRGDGENAFTTGSVTSVVNVAVNASIVLRERLQVTDEFPLAVSCGLRNNTVSGTMVLYPVHRESVFTARAILDAQSQFCITTFDDMLVVRYLGDKAEQAKTGFTQVWSKIRVSMNGKQPCVPRIWAT